MVRTPNRGPVECSVQGCSQITDAQAPTEEEFGVWLCDIDNNRYGSGSHFTEFMQVPHNKRQAWVDEKVHNLGLSCSECGQRPQGIDYLCRECRYG